MATKYERFDPFDDDVVIRGWFPGDGLVGSDANDIWSSAEVLLAKRCSYAERLDEGEEKGEWQLEVAVRWENEAQAASEVSFLYVTRVLGEIHLASSGLFVGDVEEDCRRLIQSTSWAVDVLRGIGAQILEIGPHQDSCEPFDPNDAASRQQALLRCVAYAHERMDSGLEASIDSYAGALARIGQCSDST